MTDLPIEEKIQMRIEKKLDWLHWAIDRGFGNKLNPQMIGFTQHDVIFENNLPKWPE